MCWSRSSSSNWARSSAASRQPQGEFSYDEALVEAVLARCTEVDSGARNVDNILNGTLLPEIAESVLARMAEGAAISKIKVSANKQGQFKYSVK
jgi:type VI secretion system protein VasG